MRQLAWEIAVRLTAIAPMGVGILLACGCKHPADARVTEPSARTTATIQETPASPVQAATSTAPAVVDYQDKGAHLQYVKTWKPTDDKDYDLHLVPAIGAGNSCNIMFDVPDLPPHFPGMIRLGLIENGYVDDLKKKHSGLHADSSADHPLGGGAKARLVQCSWKQDGMSYTNIGLLIMRNDHVYILSCDAEAKALPETRADFDKIAGSLHWDK